MLVGHKIYIQMYICVHTHKEKERQIKTMYQHTYNILCVKYPHVLVYVHTHMHLVTFLYIAYMAIGLGNSPLHTTFRRLIPEAPSFGHHQPPLLSENEAFILMRLSI